MYDHVAHLEVASPHDDDRALLLAVTGPGAIDSVRAADTTTTAVFFRSSTSGVSRIAVFGDIDHGARLSFRVPDESRLDEYQVELLDAAGPDGVLRTDAANYQAELRSELD